MSATGVRLQTHGLRSPAYAWRFRRSQSVCDQTESVRSRQSNGLWCLEGLQGKHTDLSSDSCSGRTSVGRGGAMWWHSSLCDVCFARSDRAGLWSLRGICLRILGLCRMARLKPKSFLAAKPTKKGLWRPNIVTTTSFLSCPRKTGPDNRRVQPVPQIADRRAVRKRGRP